MAERMYLPLPQGYEDIAAKIVDAAFEVHKTLGPGLLEKIYEVCFCHELKKTRAFFPKAGSGSHPL